MFLHYIYLINLCRFSFLYSYYKWCRSHFLNPPLHFPQNFGPWIPFLSPQFLFSVPMFSTWLHCLTYDLVNFKLIISLINVFSRNCTFLSLWDMAIWIRCFLIPTIASFTPLVSCQVLSLVKVALTLYKHIFQVISYTHIHIIQFQTYTYTYHTYHKFYILAQSPSHWLCSEMSYNSTSN